MTGIITFMFVVGLLFFAGLCYFGVRRDRAPWSILAIFAFLALAFAAQAYLVDLARLWSGRAAEQKMLGAEVFLAMFFVAWRHRGWIGEGRLMRKTARLKGPGGRQHAGR